jgi:phosphoglycerate dehydrogenase-like enzyme
VPKVEKIGILYHRCNSTPYDLTAEHMAAICAVAPGAQIIHCESEADMLLHGLDCDVILNSRHLPLSMRYYSQASELRWIQCLMSGVDELLIPEMRSRIILTATKGTLHYQVAEHAVALIFALSRGLHYARDNQRRKIWEKIESAGEILGKSAGIVGFGTIGREIARKCRLLGMRVLVTKRTPSNLNEDVDAFYPLEQLEELLKVSDFVVLIVPYTPKTHHMIGEKQLGVMKKSAFLINVARGRVVDQEALKRALRENEIAGAALDVVCHEPLPSDDELWEMDNVIITPHMAAVSPHFMDRAVEKFCENLAKYIAGQPLDDVVRYNEGGY